MTSNTQTIWYDLLQLPHFDAGKPLANSHAHCYLCGGNTQGQGYRLRDGLGSLFTDTALVKTIDSNAVCGSCAALMCSIGYQQACERYGFDAYFPIKDGKKPLIANWMFYSHCFSTKKWQKMDRAEARDVLLSPPEPPFVITLASVGKKHVIFRAAVNHSRERFSVQIDELSVLIDRAVFTDLLKYFEAAYALGLSKDSLVTGNYNHAACLKIGVQQWRQIDNYFQIARLQVPDLLKVVSFCAKKIENNCTESI